MSIAEQAAGIVEFRPQGADRCLAVIGRVIVGEIAPTQQPSRLPLCFKLYLPECRNWQPASNMRAAREALLTDLNDWLNAADLQPVGKR